MFASLLVVIRRYVFRRFAPEASFSRIYVIQSTLAVGIIGIWTKQLGQY